VNNSSQTQAEILMSVLQIKIIKKISQKQLLQLKEDQELIKPLVIIFKMTLVIAKKWWSGRNKI